MPVRYTFLEAMGKPHGFFYCQNEIIFKRTEKRVIETERRIYADAILDRMPYPHHYTLQG